MKTETLEEFLARGGKITKVPPNSASTKVDSVKSAPGGPVVLMTLDEADLYYGEHKVKKKPVRKKSKELIDINALPEALRKKYIDSILYAQKDEDDQEES